MTRARHVMTTFEIAFVERYVTEQNKRGAATTLRAAGYTRLTSDLPMHIIGLADALSFLDQHGVNRRKLV